MTISAGADSEPDARLPVGAIFRRSASLLRRDFIPFVILGGLAMLPYLWVMFTRTDLTPPLRDVAPGVPPAVAANFSLSRIAAFVLRSFGGTLILILAFGRLRGEPVRRRDLLRAAAARLPSVTAISVCQSAALLIGDLLLHMRLLPRWMPAGAATLLLAPAAIALTIPWYLAPSVCVLERAGVLASLARGAALTRGQRVKLVGVNVAIAMPAVAAGAGLNRIAAQLGSPAVYAIMEYALQGVYGAFSMVVGVVIYQALRTGGQGSGAERIVAVFE